MFQLLISVCSVGLTKIVSGLSVVDQYNFSGASVVIQWIISSVSVADQCMFSGSH